MSETKLDAVRADVLDRPVMTLTDLRTAASALKEMDDAIAALSKLGELLPLMTGSDAQQAKNLEASATKRVAACEASLANLGIALE